MSLQLWHEHPKVLASSRGIGAWWLPHQISSAAETGIEIYALECERGHLALLPERLDVLHQSAVGPPRRVSIAHVRLAQLSLQPQDLYITSRHARRQGRATRQSPAAAAAAQRCILQSRLSRGWLGEGRMKASAIV